MDISNLPEIEFVSVDADATKQELVNRYTEITGRTLAPADPVQLFLSTIAAEIVLLKNNINETGKQNLLRYAKGENLEHLGALLGVERKQATKAITTIQVTLSEARPEAIIIPAGTRFTAGDSVFFALDSPMIIAIGQTQGAGQATCTESGAKGNGYLPNQIKTLVDPVAYVQSITNTTTSEGGADIESDELLRERIRVVPESFSCAGPSGAYEYFAKAVNVDIVDVSVLSPTPGAVVVRPLMKGGVIPGTEIIDEVFEALNDRAIRPLTDNLSVVAPIAEQYNINLTYYINTLDNSLVTDIQTAVNNAIEDYVSWQHSKLGRDINPSELISRIMQAGALRVVLTAPTHTVIDRTKVAKLNTKNIVFGGLEDE